jgi:hypothetical protein
VASTSARRPLPALAFLVGLLVLASLVWWRVIHRSDTEAQAAARASVSATASPTCAIARVTTVPEPGQVRVDVLNSTNRSGLAHSASSALTHLGFASAGYGNDQTSRAPVTGVAEIRFGPSGQAAATLLSFYVPGATLVPITRTTSIIDLALGAKYQTLATRPAAASAMAAAHIVMSATAASATPTATSTC